MSFSPILVSRLSILGWKRDWIRLTLLGWVWSPEDQGHVKTEIPEALPLSHSLEFFIFKERGGRARFASSCPVKKKKVNKRKNKTQQNAQSTSGKQKTIEKRKKRGRAQSQRVRSSVPPFGNQMMRGSRLDDRVILYTPEKPSYSISFFLPSSSGTRPNHSPRFAKLMLQVSHHFNRRPNKASFGC